MPKTKKLASKKAESDIQKLIRKNEFVIGAITLITAAALIGISLAKLNSEKSGIKTSISTVNTKIDPQATQSAKVTKLSSTTGEKYALVLKGDSYFRITKRVCGSGKNFLFVAKMNDNQSLHPGESIKISCSL